MGKFECVLVKSLNCCECLKDESRIYWDIILSAGQIQSQWLYKVLTISLPPSSYKITKTFLQRIRQELFTGLKGNIGSYCSNCPVTGHSRQEVTDPPRVRCDSLKHHWMASTAVNLLHIQLQGFHFVRQPKYLQIRNSLPYQRLGHLTRLSEMKPRPCASYCRQKNLSKFEAEY